MSQKLYEENSIQDIANAIRSQNGTHDAYTIAQMGNAIRAIKTQPNLEPLTVNQNGTYIPSVGKDGFSSVSVNVEGGDEAVVQPLNVTKNGTYNPPSGVDGFSSVTVNVSGGGSIPVIYSNDGTLAAFIDQSNNRFVWYFMGFTKASGDVAIPTGMCISQPGLLYSKAYDSDKETQIGQIGFYNGNIRSWDISTSRTLAGTFWGVVYSNGGQGQTNPYSDPPA